MIQGDLAGSIAEAFGSDIVENYIGHYTVLAVRSERKTCKKKLEARKGYTKGGAQM